MFWWPLLLYIDLLNLSLNYWQRDFIILLLVMARWNRKSYSNTSFSLVALFFIFSLLQPKKWNVTLTLIFFLPSKVFTVSFTRLSFIFSKHFHLSGFITLYAVKWLRTIYFSLKLFSNNFIAVNITLTLFWIYGVE